MNKTQDALLLSLPYLNDATTLKCVRVISKDCEYAFRNDRHIRNLFTEKFIIKGIYLRDLTTELPKSKKLIFAEESEIPFEMVLDPGGEYSNFESQVSSFKNLIKQFTIESNIYYFPEIVSFLVEIFKSKNFPNLTRLKFNELMMSKESFRLPEEICQDITSFELSKVSSTIFELDKCPKLKELTLGDVGNKCTIKLGDLSSLTQLTFSCAMNNIELSNSFPKLNHITIPKALDITVAYPFPDGLLQSPNLTTLTIKSFGLRNYNKVDLSGFENCKKFIFGKVKTATLSPTVTLPENVETIITSMRSTLELGDNSIHFRKNEHYYVKIKFSKGYVNLKNIIICDEVFKIKDMSIDTDREDDPEPKDENRATPFQGEDLIEYTSINKDRGDELEPEDENTATPSESRGLVRFCSIS